MKKSATVVIGVVLMMAFAVVVNAEIVIVSKTPTSISTMTASCFNFTGFESFRRVCVYPESNLSSVEIDGLKKAVWAMMARGSKDMPMTTWVEVDRFPGKFFTHFSDGVFIYAVGEGKNMEGAFEDLALYFLSPQQGEK